MIATNIRKKCLNTILKLILMCDAIIIVINKKIHFINQVNLIILKSPQNRFTNVSVCISYVN